jgi:ADP-sugar diphosphatase
MSSTFTLPHIDPPVTVTLVSGLSKDQLVSFPAFKTWMSTLQHSLSLQTKQSHVFYNSPYTLRGIVVQAIDYFGGGRLGFVKLKADISNASGEKLPGSVFLRGGSVCMMVRYTTESLMRT